MRGVKVEEERRVRKEGGGKMDGRGREREMKCLRWEAGDWGEMTI